MIHSSLSVNLSNVTFTEGKSHSLSHLNIILQLRIISRKTSQTQINTHMSKLGVFAVSFLSFMMLFVLLSNKKIPQQPQLVIPLPPPQRPKKVSIRLLVLRHTPGGMAESDSSLAKNAAQKAASKGLEIKVIGDHLISSTTVIKDLVSKEMDSQATPEDTLIIHTIGHGFASGGLQNIGSREGIFKTLASAASEKKQRTIWWQLSCYATAKLPGIETLSADEQKYFMVLASSRANDTSTTRTQAMLMEKIFAALADKSNKIDPNGDNVITISEFKEFLNTLDSYRRGELFFSHRDDVFGKIVMFRRR
jgi:hypothetical protein